MRRFRSRSCSSTEYRPDGRHRFEHWYRDKTIYFITARCRDRYPTFQIKEAKQVFWDRFNHWTQHYGFVPLIATLMNNHYHTLGYLGVGENLGPMMQRLHGSVSKLVNDLLPERRLPFWCGTGRHDYFDGCIRDELQCRRAYRYTLLQSVRHGIAKDWRHFPDTRVYVDLDVAVRRALQINAFLLGIPYKRYER